MSKVRTISEINQEEEDAEMEKFSDLSGRMIGVLNTEFFKEYLALGMKHKRLLKTMRKLRKDRDHYVALIKENNRRDRSAEQAIEVLQFQAVIEKWERLPHLLKILKIVPEAIVLFIENSHLLCPWANVGGLPELTQENAEVFSQQIIAFENEMLEIVKEE